MNEVFIKTVATELPTLEQTARTSVAAAKRLKAAKGNHASAVRTAVRGLARAEAHATWLQSQEMVEFATDADRQAADVAASDLATVVALLVLDAPTGTFTPNQVATARRALD